MSHLSHRAEELVRAGREAGRSTEDDRERILAALQGRLGDGALLGNTSTAPARPRVARPFWRTAAAVGVGLGAAAALALTIRGERPSSGPSHGSPTRHIVLEATPPLPSQAVEPETPPAPVTSAAESGPAAESGSAAARRPHDRLAQEVAILSRATNYLEAGRASDALRALDEHQRKFPNGILTEERYSARVQALCALGRRTEAAAVLAHLSRIAPESPHLVRARQACAAAAAPSSSAD
jgi:hypothetical protein